MEVQNFPLGGPKPITTIEDLTIKTVHGSPTTCNCGGTCGGDCNCGGTCDENCGCKDLSVPQEAQPVSSILENTTKKVSDVSKKYVTNENMLKLAIALAVGVAAYVIIND